MQRFQRPLLGWLKSEAVDLVEIHIIGLQPPQAVVDGAQYMLAPEAALVRIVAHGVEDLRRNHHAVARWGEILPGAAQDLLSHSHPVPVDGTYEVHPQLPSA